MTDRARTMLIGVGAVLLMIGLGSGWLLLPLRDWAEGFTMWVHGLGALGPVLFVFAYVAAVIALVPASVMTLAGGLAFGAFAFPLVLVAATTGSVAAFLVSRYLLNAKVKRMVADLPRAKAVYDAMGKGGWKLVFLLRLSPFMPFSMLNYVLGVTEIGMSAYAVATCVGILPGLTFYVYLGALGRAAIAGAEGGTIRWILLGLGIVAGAAAIVQVTRSASAELRRSGLPSA
ncbi:Uncharacterized membrane protein YdjX, TVP38/TMEM64 family, SNARE-associated domain [Rhizobiales bacterium GAS191]|nr:Uncharacterized membrane protein YdjX, TVP38/TMEM64 family, SNARE-associated domain [Rhizobiales bacterium GAS191]